MEIKEKLGAVEAVLFASGEPIELYRISEACGVEVGSVPSLIKLLNERYDDCGSGICIKKLDSSYQMCTREEFAPQIKTALETKKSTPLSNAAMETLTIIAYNQPVSKGFVENVRGVDSSSVVNNLVEKGLVEEAGRLDVPGKPIIYKTTPVFLRSFGLSSIADLPPLPGHENVTIDDEGEQISFDTVTDEESDNAETITTNTEAAEDAAEHDISD
ncbi:MAG TPA: SMC-Scp complex subunit ScpB [Ruminococcus sp.]|jgi:segregation and condensation protein B|nr:SMC-Scp complex subunit ScpB [Ruminococcus sp.]